MDSEKVARILIRAIRTRVYKDPRKAFRLMLDPKLYDEINARAQQRFMSMTAYMVRAILLQIEQEKKFE
jgi:hypothetical protein